MSIVTHMNPDFDAITSVWLLKRFGGLEKEPIEFVNTGNPDRELLAKAKAVVDTGRNLDPARRRFDHHHLPGQESNDTCAAMQVYEWLMQDAWITNDPSRDISYLEPLINLIFAGDTGRAEANASRELGLHAILSGWKAWSFEQNPDARLSNEAILAYGFGLLDVLEVRLRKQAQARVELAEKVVYKSGDGLIWAIRHGSIGSTFAAYEQGARLVVFEGEPIEVEGGTTYPIGIMRGGEWQEPHIGDIVSRIIEQDENTAIKAELQSWFCHPAGFFGGRGTAKAPVFKPVEIDLERLARQVDYAWQRRL